MLCNDDYDRYDIDSLSSRAQAGDIRELQETIRGEIQNAIDRVIHALFHMWVRSEITLDPDESSEAIADKMLEKHKERWEHREGE